MKLSPGLYKATVRGVPDVTVLLNERNEWRSIVQVKGMIGHHHNDITDARPLIVLDTKDSNGTLYHQLVAYLRRGGWGITADQIEAQTKPARIPEPGLWGVVEASSMDYSSRRTYLHSLDGKWGSVKGFNRWDRLLDPTLIRDGIES